MDSESRMRISFLGSVYFSPKGGATEACVATIAAAKTTIGVQAYSFPSEPIAAALVTATKRGVTIAAIIDKSQKTASYTARIPRAMRAGRRE